MSRAIAAFALCFTACTVPDLTIQEQGSSAVTSDAAVDAGELEDARDAGSKRPTRTGTAPAAGGSGGKAGSAAKPAANSGGGGGTTVQPMQATAAGSGGAAGTPAANGGAAGSPGMPARCAVWTSVGARDSNPPPGAVEGGFETVAGVTNRQYVCRFRPSGSSVTIPGKYEVGLGCYVTRRTGQSVDDASMLDGMFEVLTPAAGCSFSWRSASPSELPAGAIDLGDPAGGSNYACHGDYSTVASSGKQIGNVIASTDNPPQYQCWMESFAAAIQPSDPKAFEVLVQD